MAVSQFSVAIIPSNECQKKGFNMLMILEVECPKSMMTSVAKTTPTVCDVTGAQGEGNPEYTQGSG